MIFNTLRFLTLPECFLAVPDFPHIFAAYFYRGEFAELLFCHIVNVVDKGLRVVTMEDRFEADRQKALYRGLSLHELSMVHFRLLQWWNTQMNLNESISKSMRPTRKCEFCGKTFVPRSGMQKYCSEDCQAEAKRLRKKRQQDLINGIEPIMDLQHQEYLTFSKAAILMGCTRQYIYKLVANGKLKASRLSSRMAFVRKTDIEKMFKSNPYKRVIPVSKSKLSKKAKTEKPTQNQESIKGKEENEVLDYYSGEEVMSIYKVKKSWLYTSAKRNQIPMCRIAGKNYYSKRHIDEFFGTAVDIHCITEWVTADDVEEAFSMSKSALRAYTYRHKIPTKREYGRTYYSKEHLEELRRTDLMSDDNYYTTEQVQQLYGLTSANICHIVRVHHISKVKVGVKNLLLKTDVERAMAERAAKGL